MSYPLGLPICHWCKHFDKNKFEDRNHRLYVCKAFPEAIPLVILDMEFDHRMPFEGDNNLQFEKYKHPIDLPVTVRELPLGSDNVLTLMLQLMTEKRMIGKALPPLDTSEIDADSKNFSLMYEEFSRQAHRKYLMKSLIHYFTRAANSLRFIFSRIRGKG